MKNLRDARYISSELAGLQGDKLRGKQARLQELLNAADLQQQAMESDREASGTPRNNCLVVAGRDKSQAQQASSPNQGQAEHSRSNRAPGKTVETTAPSTLATIAGSLEIWLWSPASHAIPLGLMWRSQHATKLWCMLRQLPEPGMALKDTRRHARMWA
jgi:hypothetical protein